METWRRSPEGLNICELVAAKNHKTLTHEYYYNNEYCHVSKPHLCIFLKGLGIMQSHPPTMQDVHTSLDVYLKLHHGQDLIGCVAYYY